LQSSDQGGTVSNTAFCLKNIDNKWRYKILFDEYLQLPKIGAAGGEAAPAVISQTQSFVVKKYVKLRGLITQYQADSSPAVISDFATGALYTLLITAQNAPGTSQWILSSSYRLTYTDE
jgi:hypothetical protein